METSINTGQEPLVNSSFPPGIAWSVRNVRALSISHAAWYLMLKNKVQLFSMKKLKSEKRGVKQQRKH